jgi:hypothetical protein
MGSNQSRGFTYTSATSTTSSRAEPGFAGTIAYGHDLEDWFVFVGPDGERRVGDGFTGE